MDPAQTDVAMTEHRRRIEFADRFGPLYSPDSVSAAPRRPSTSLTAAFANLSRLVGAAWHGLGNLPYDSREALRSDEHDLATQGITWPVDGEYDAELAGEAQAARQRRLVTGTITPLTSARLALDRGSASRKPTASSGEAVVLVGRRLRISTHAAVVGGGRQSGD